MSLSLSCWSSREFHKAEGFTSTCCADPVLRDTPQAPTMVIINTVIFQTAIPTWHWTRMDVPSPQRQHQHQLQTAGNKDDFSRMKNLWHAQQLRYPALPAVAAFLLPQATILRWLLLPVSPIPQSELLPLTGSGRPSQVPL